MYLPARFALSDPTILHAVMEAHPFATLITTGPEGISGDHLPLLFEPTEGERGILRGHIARANQLWHAGEREALAIFQGPQAYITPSWYPDKKLHGRVVPTWNYQVVHAHGQLRFNDDPSWLRWHVEALVEHFENQRKLPWALRDAPDNYIEGMCRAIVGVELVITRLTGKHKASQHKSHEERMAIRQGLREECGIDATSAACLSGTLE